MTPDEQRIALAEWAGWRFRGSNETAFGAECALNKWHNPQGKVAALPDITDLNVLHEYEAKLDAMDVDTRSMWLDCLAVAGKWPATKNAADLRFEVQYLTARATAAQRAEALLRTLNLWQDSTAAMGGNV